VAISTIESPCYTIHDLELLPADGRLRELVGGQIVEWDVTTQRQAFLEALLAEHLGRFVRAHHLGRIGTGEGMVRIRSSDRDARGYDVAFYRRGRFPRDVDAAATVTPPDFVVELLSPTDRAAMVEAKVDDWLRAGVELLWYINPETGTTTVYSQGTIRRVPADQPLDGGLVLPGLHFRLQELLDELAADDAE
jgi:Uma2 family endonuclease